MSSGTEMISNTRYNFVNKIIGIATCLPEIRNKFISYFIGNAEVEQQE